MLIFIGLVLEREYGNVLISFICVVFDIDFLLLWLLKMEIYGILCLINSWVYLKMVDCVLGDVFLLIWFFDSIIRLGFFFLIIFLIKLIVFVFVLYLFLCFLFYLLGRLFLYFFIFVEKWILVNCMILYCLLFFICGIGLVILIGVFFWIVMCVVWNFFFLLRSKVVELVSIYLVFVLMVLFLKRILIVVMVDFEFDIFCLEECLI